MNKNQSRLKEFLLHVEGWRDAAETASFEVETDWDLVQRVAEDKCFCHGGCNWWTQVQTFFVRNKAFYGCPRGRRRALSLFSSWSKDPRNPYSEWK